jgi:hypothetical protein
MDCDSNDADDSMTGVYDCVFLHSEAINNYNIL